MRAHSARKAPLKVSAVTVLAVAALVAMSDSEPGTVAAKAAASAKNGQIAFRRFFDQAHRRGAIFLVSPDGTGERQITQPPADAIDAQFGPPSIAPDGSKVLFTRTQAGTDELWTVDVDDGHEQRISPMPRFDHPVGH